MAKGRNENHKLNNIKLSRENTKCGEAALFIMHKDVQFSQNRNKNRRIG